MASSKNASNQSGGWFPLTDEQISQIVGRSVSSIESDRLKAWIVDRMNHTAPKKRPRPIVYLQLLAFRFFSGLGFEDLLNRLVDNARAGRRL